MVTEAPDPWTTPLREAWARIEAHDFDPPLALSFTRRLARDKGWTGRFARGAVDEYRRFCLLTLASQTPVTPSEEVDEVWHLHLTYTRDYWDRWCGQVLGATLHHDPTEGSAGERLLFARQYAETLALYERFFGPPDPAYWPSTRARFGPAPRYRTLDSKAWFFVPRPAWRLRQ